MAAFFCIVTSSVSLGQSIPFIGDIGSCQGIARKLFDIIELKSKIDVFDTKDKAIDGLKGEISFKYIHFSYPTRQDVKVLKGLSLDIPAGKTVAFCGSSGCGKSTTIALLQRFYLPESGSIQIDGTNIEDLDLNWLRKQIAVVSQEPLLFTTTIRYFKVFLIFY